MNRMWLRRCAGAAAVLFIAAGAGCSSVTVDAPIGGSEMAVEAQEWAGKWGDARRDPVERGDYVDITVTDGAKGMLRFVIYEKSKNDGEGVVYLRGTEDWTFFNLEPDAGEDEKSEQEGYLWGRVRVGDGIMLLWLPSFPEFKKLVEEGSLPGRIDADTVHLENLTEEHMKVVMSEMSGELFGWSEPMVLIRAGYGEEEIK